MTIDQKTKEFIEFINESEAFKAYRQACSALEMNAQAQKLIEDVEERKQTVLTLQSQGLPLSNEQIEEFNRAVELMKNNDVCSDYLNTQKSVDSLARDICNKLSSATGVTFKSGGCCGGGGCC